MPDWKLAIIGRDNGGAIPGASTGAQAIYTHAFAQDHPVIALGHPHPHFLEPAHSLKAPLHTRLKHWIEALHQVVEPLGQVLQQHRLLALSGDHSSALACAAALHQAFPKARIGLIWLDAHADLHSPWTSHSGNPHGMPLAAILGLDHHHLARHEIDTETALYWQQLKAFCNGHFHPDDLLYIGLRSVEIEEARALQELDLTYWTPQDLNPTHLPELTAQIRRFFKDYDHVYVSLDVDVLDPYYMPGTGTPVAGGLTTDFLLPLLEALFADLPVRLLEIVEYNPTLDRHGNGLRTILHLLEQLAPYFQSTS